MLLELLWKKGGKGFPRYIVRFINSDSSVPSAGVRLSPPPAPLRSTQKELAI